MNLATLVDRALPGAGSRLDRFTRAAQSSVAEVATRPGIRPVVKALHGNEWLGHPLHPVVIGVPIGAWSVTGWYDWRGARSADPRFDSAADAALRVGIAGAVVAALTGLPQYLDTRSAARRETAVHTALNNLALGFYAASLAARSAGQRPLGRRLAALALGVVGVSGYLGGDLAYRHGVGVRHPELTPPPTDGS